LKKENFYLQIEGMLCYHQLQGIICGDMITPSGENGAVAIKQGTEAEG